MIERPARRHVTRGIAASVAGVTLLACQSSELQPSDNPVPIVEALEPDAVARGAAASVSVLGLGFVEGAEVRWNGQSRSTTFLDEAHLVVSLAAEDLLAGTSEIDVVNPPPGGGASSTVTLVVGNAAPSLASISPTQAPAVITSALTLHAEGSDFASGSSPSVMLWNGIALVTDVASATELNAMVPDYLLRVGHTAEIRVRNPAPGGGASNALFFDVENPVPTVTGTEPDGVPANTAADLDVLGSGFVYGASVWINGSSLSPTSVSATTLTVHVPAAATAGTTGLASLHVTNPGPGGGASNEVDLTVWLAPPQIDFLYPAQVFAGAGDFPLVISGADFDPGATVTLNGAPRAAVVVSSTRIEMTILASDVATNGTIQVTVINPHGAGQASTDLTVLAPPAAGSVLLAERGFELALLDVAGAEVQVVQTPGGSYRVDASPVGSTALYQAGRIFEIDPYTGTVRRVSTASAEAALGEEQWGRYSADGAWIYFMGSVGGRWELWRTPAQGGSSSQLLAHGTDSYGYPSPSHQGDRVVYARGVSQGSTAALTVLDLTTSSSTPLGVQGATSRWTPDDEWIVYWTWNRELRAVRPDGTSDFPLTSGIQVAAGFDISPAGDYIVAAREDGTGAVLIEFPSGTVHPLAGAGSVGSMAWYGP
jgi:hypothetical protein